MPLQQNVRASKKPTSCMHLRNPNAALCNRTEHSPILQYLSNFLIIL